MLKWFRRKVEEEEPTYCGFILMQSDWYKKQVEAGLLDDRDFSITTLGKEQLEEPKAQGYRNVKYIDLATRRNPKSIRLEVPAWVR